MRGPCGGVYKRFTRRGNEEMCRNRKERKIENDSTLNYDWKVLLVILFSPQAFPHTVYIDNIPSRQ